MISLLFVINSLEISGSFNLQFALSNAFYIASTLVSTLSEIV